MRGPAARKAALRPWIVALRRVGGIVCGAGGDGKVGRRVIRPADCCVCGEADRLRDAVVYDWALKEG